MNTETEWVRLYPARRIETEGYGSGEVRNARGTGSEGYVSREVRSVPEGYGALHRVHPAPVYDREGFCSREVRTCRLLYIASHRWMCRTKVLQRPRCTTQ